MNHNLLAKFATDVKGLPHSVSLFLGMSYCLSDYKTLITELANRVRNEAENVQDQLGTKPSSLA